MNPRDAAIIGVARLHRMIRRSTSYGPMLPEGVLEDDGADRGILFVCLQANLARQFEFVKTQWINEGTFFGTPDEKDPLVGPNDGSGQFTIPQQPIRRRLTGAAPVRGQPRRRVLLHARPAAPCAGSPSSTPEPADPTSTPASHDTADARLVRLASPATPSRSRHRGRLDVPQPERPGRLVLVMNVFPIAVPTALFSDALSCRFRLRPVTAIAAAWNAFRGRGRRVDDRLQVRPLPSRDSARYHDSWPAIRGLRQSRGVDFWLTVGGDRSRGLRLLELDRASRCATGPLPLDRAARAD